MTTVDADDGLSPPRPGCRRFTVQATTPVALSRHIPAVIEGVLFDLDDTLIDYSSAARAGLRSLLAALGVKENEEHWLLWPALGAPTLRRVSRRNLLVR
ncbi:MAG: hypothetical protein M0000_06740 [Actinomycetota bacterium]|nr:hypothetical protein [Actinomycetota bacterium]